MLYSSRLLGSSAGGNIWTLWKLAKLVMVANLSWVSLEALVKLPRSEAIVKALTRYLAKKISQSSREALEKASRELS